MSAKTPNGATLTLDKLLEEKSPAPKTTSCISGWDGCCQWGLRGADMMGMTTACILEFSEKTARESAGLGSEFL